MDAVAQQRFGNVGERRHETQADPQPQVLRRKVTFGIPDPGALEQRTAHEGGRVADRGIAQQVRNLDVFAVLRMAIRAVDPAEHGEPCAAHAHVRTRIHELDLPGEALGQRHVVGIHARDVLAAALGKPAVQGLRDADVGRVLEDADTRIAPRVLVQDLEAPVGRSVIDDDELEIGEALFEHAVDRFVQERHGIQHRHQH
jgi:hypothetical protein